MSTTSFVRRFETFSLSSIFHIALLLFVTGAFFSDAAWAVTHYMHKDRLDNSASYTYDSGVIDVSNGIAKLKHRPTLDDSLVGYWDLNESTWTGAADEVIDRSPTANHGYAVGTTENVTGILSGGFRADDSTDYIRIPHHNAIAFDDDTDEWSVSFWFNPEPTTGNAAFGIVSKGSPYSNNGIGWDIHWLATWSGVVQNKLRVRVNNGSGLAVTVVSSSLGDITNQWSHFVVTFDRDGLVRIYHNGVQAGVAVSIASKLGNIGQADVFIGKLGNGSSYGHPQNLDELAIWDRVLTTSEISTLHNAGNATTPTEYAAELPVLAPNADLSVPYLTRWQPLWHWAGDSTLGAVRYQLSFDQGTTWHWYDSQTQAWAPATDPTQSNHVSEYTPAVIESLFKTDASGYTNNTNMKWRAVFDSDGTEPVELDEINIGYQTSVIPGHEGLFTLDGNSNITISTVGSFDIVTGNDHSPDEVVADTLEEYVLRATGRTAQGSLSGAGPDVHFLLETRSPIWHEIVPANDIALTDLDSFEIRITDTPQNQVHIIGTTSQAVGIGVMYFLENFLGIRWLMPGEMGIELSAQTSFTLATPPLRVYPWFSSRMWTGYLYSDLAEKLAYTIPVSQRPGSVIHKQRLFFHGYDYFKTAGIHQLASASHNMFQLFKNVNVEDPNWSYYAPYLPATIDASDQIDPNNLVNQIYPKLEVPDAQGNVYHRPTSSTDYTWHPCYMSPIVREITIAQGADKFDGNLFMLSLGINDGKRDRCYCDACVAIGWPDAYYDYVNHVADELDALGYFPPHMIGVLGYGDVATPPANLQLHPMVLVNAASGGNNRFETWEGKVQNLSTYERIFGMGFLVPNFPWEVMEENFKVYKERNINMWHSENHSMWAFDAPKIYILSRMMWDPELDMNATYDTFCQAAFGPASTAMKDFYDLLASLRDGDAVTGKVASLWSADTWPSYTWRRSTPQLFFAPTTLYDDLDTHLTSAENTAGLSAKQLDRLAMIRAFLDFAHNSYETYSLVDEIFDDPAVTPNWTNLTQEAVDLRNERDTIIQTLADANNAHWTEGASTDIDQMLSDGWEDRGEWALTPERDRMLIKALFEMNKAGLPLGSISPPTQFMDYYNDTTYQTVIPVVHIWPTNAWYPPELFVPISATKLNNVVTFQTGTTDVVITPSEHEDLAGRRKPHWASFFSPRTLPALTKQLMVIEVDATGLEGTVSVTIQQSGNVVRMHTFGATAENKKWSFTIAPRFLVDSTPNPNVFTYDPPADTPANFFIHMVFNPDSDTASFSGTVTYELIDFGP